jgi:hypothetical protein
VSKRANLGRLAGAVILAVIAIVLITSGLNQQQAPKCNNITMKPGDLCILSTGAVTYEQRKADSSKIGLVQLGLGGVAVIGGTVLLGLYLRNRRRADPEPPPDPS